MKGKILQLIFSLIVLQSCQSEYEKQLVFGKALIRTECQLYKTIEDNGFTQTIGEQLDSISIAIDQKAHVSGNEELFLNELNKYRISVLQKEEISNKLISKYP